MALSVIQQPPELIMAYQPVTIVLQSDATATPLRMAAGVTAGDADMVQADANKKATFELSDYLQGLITTRHKTGAVASVYSDVPRTVTFNYIEWSGNPPVDTFDLEEQGPFYLLDGAIPPSRRKALYTTYDTVLAFLAASKNCLTWWPATEAKNVAATQPEFLNYLQVYSQTPINVACRVSFAFTDGTTVDNAVVLTVTALDYLQLVYFPTGYTELGIALIMAEAYPDKVLQTYSAVIKTGSTAISQIYTYQPDLTFHPNPRILYIRNAFGLLEVLRTSGLTAQDNAITTEIIKTDGTGYPHKMVWRTTAENVVKANTGFLTGAQMQWLSDMDFREAYELINTTLHPIALRNLSLPVVHDQVYQYSAELEYEYTYQNYTETNEILS